MNQITSVLNLAWVEVDTFTNNRWTVFLPTVENPDWVLRRRIGYKDFSHVDWTPPANWCIVSTQKEID